VPVDQDDKIVSRLSKSRDGAMRARYFLYHVHVRRSL